MKRAASVGAGATEGVTVALSAPRAAEVALAGPDEGRRVGVPAAGGRFEPVPDLAWGGRRLPIEGAADADALDGLGHVQPGAAQVVQDQEQPQRWQAFG